MARTSTIYIVRWPDEQIFKIGKTVLPSRVRKFEIRGALVTRLMLNKTDADERRLLSIARQYGRRAFDEWQQAVSLLGAGGTGFTECYRADFHQWVAFMAEVDRAYPQHEA